MTLHISTKSPKSEQNICVSCGMCCDGTLFLHACLNPDEIGNLPEKIEQNVFTEAENNYFRLPCLYFIGKCSIYNQKRADVCPAFRCQLLRNFTVDRLSLNNALDIVKKAVRMRDEIFSEYSKLSGEKKVFFFKQLLADMTKLNMTETLNETKEMQIKLLQAKCNILEALLVKHFRPAGDFRDLMAENDVHNISF
jgi:hypothetical protein